MSDLDLHNSYERPTCGDHGACVRDCLPADENSHTIGTVLFGPDGMLYVGNGDGCDFFYARPACTRALDLDSLAGKILRLDPTTGQGLPDNPYFDGFLAEDHGDNTAYELCLNATDEQGRVGRACRILRPNQVAYVIDSEPSGLMITWKGVARETPFTVQTHVAGSRARVAPAQQNGLNFVSWSDRGVSSHEIEIDSVPRRLVARYQAAP